MSAGATRGPRRRRLIVRALLVPFGILAALGVWRLQPRPLLPEATASLASTPTVAFAEVDGRLEWRPTATEPRIGLVVYPGGAVPAAAYGPLAQAIAAAGYLVTIVPMPVDLAVLDVDAADRAIAAHPEIATWAIGGHSLGGSMASQYVADRPGRVAALAMWAAYTVADLSAAPLVVLSAWGSLDADARRMGGAEARAAVPADAVFLEIPGGNHEQMGWYTGQPDDPPATIERADQVAAVVQATVELLDRLAADAR